MFAFLSRQSITVKAILVVVVIAVLFGSGFVVATWRNASLMATASKREQEARAAIAANEAENNRLRGVNEQIRKEIAELSAEKAAILQNIKEHGGAIASETKKLEQINETLKTDQAVVSAPADSCTRCRFSISLSFFSVSVC